ncbi:hypothetical protein R3W88_033459 [Solanum pinnatisectum]|uniref:Integrase core domain containing protein n=1 Tax=Solanum pinnatisectum TaxID=50273 RepID=A0AAV9K1A8_9SOLN|nr:hypothetical protein R3W88_033459 [Solanum pinnatisectum]
MYEEDDADLDGAGATVAIMLPPLPPDVKFTITSTMIQLLNLKGMFRGAASDDANKHLMNFVTICKSQEIPGVNQTAMRLRLFLLSLTREKAFLERFFPESQELQMKDEISTHKQLPGEAMHDTWWRFSQKLKKCPNHDLTERHLKQAFYMSLNYVNLSLLLMSLWRLIYKESEKVNAVGQQNRYEDQDLDLDEGANYLGNQGGFRTYNSGNQGYNYGNTGRNYARDGQYDSPSNRDQGNWQTRDRYRNDRTGVYVPLGNRDWAGGSSSRSKLEDMMAKVLQKVESTDAGVKEMRGDFSKYELNGSLPSDTKQNPKKDDHCMAIATRSGKFLLTLCLQVPKMNRSWRKLVEIGMKP